jgi:hypothetical protein
MAGAWRLVRSDTAFSNAPIGKQKKRPREEDGTHLKWLRTLPCVISGERPVDAAHIRYADPIYGKRETGKGEKPSDKWTVPLARRFHDAQHGQAEREFWARHGLDPLRIALALHACSGDDDQAFVILREARLAVESFGRPGLWKASRTSEGD